MAQGERGRLLPSLLRNYLTWVGFLIPFLINLVNGLHSYFNYFPFIQLNTSLRLLRESVRLNLYPRFEVIGLSYLLSLDVSFGVWFFAFLAYVHTGAERLSPAAPALSRHGAGGFWLGGPMADHRLFWRHVELVYHVNLGAALNLPPKPQHFLDPRCQEFLIAIGDCGHRQVKLAWGR